MLDRDKTKTQLIRELNEARRRLAELEPRDPEAAAPVALRLVDGFPELACSASRDCRLSFVNRAYADYFGRSPESLRGRSFLERVHEEDKERVGRAVSSLGPERERIELEHRVVDGRGRIRWTHWTGRAVTDAAGRIEAHAVGRDVTDRRQAERVLQTLYRISEAAHFVESLDALFPRLHAALAELIDAENLYIALVNAERDRIDFRYWCDRRHPRPASRPLGKGLTEYVLRTGMPLLAGPSELAALVASGQARPQGDAPPQFWLGVPLRSSRGVLGVLAVSSYDERRGDMRRDAELLRFVSQQVADAIERRRGVEALRQSERDYRGLFESAHDAILILEPGSGRVLDANPSACRVYGRRRDDLRRLSLDDLSAQPQADRTRLLESPAQPPPRPFETVHLRSDGSEIQLECNASPTGYREGAAVLCLQRDISDRKRVEEEVARRNELLAALRRVGLELTAELDIATLLQSITSLSSSLLGGETGGVWLYRPELDRLESAAATPGRSAPPGGGPARGSGLARRVWESGSPAVQEVTTEAGTRSIVAAPIRWSEESLGVLYVRGSDGRRFGAADAEALSLFGIDAAIAIRNARLFDQTRRDAAAKEALVREVNHRVKNNLASVIGLLYAERRLLSGDLQAAYEPIMHDLIGRVQGLAVAHGLLSDAEWQPLILSRLVREVIAAVIQARPPATGVAADVEDSPIRIAPDQVNNLALMVNELATNTLKYALGGERGVHIAVRFARAGGSVILEYRDDGPGYPAEVLCSRRGSVGLPLIQTIASSALRAQVELANDAGAVTRVRFPSAL